MSLLILLENLLAGLIAGFVARASLHDNALWGCREPILSSTLTVGLFFGVFLGLQVAFAICFRERQLRKALAVFPGAAAVGLAIPMTVAVLFSLLSGLGNLALLLPPVPMRIFWWIVLAAAYSFALGICRRSLPVALHGFMGVTAGLVLGGLLLDCFFLPRGMPLVGCLCLGGSAGMSISLVSDLLKEAWLEEFPEGYPLTLWVEFRLEVDEFVVGSADSCDLTLADGPGQLFAIVEQEGQHVVEALDDTAINVANGSFRYRVLVDGDVIRWGKRRWVYRNRYARARDILVEPAC